MAIGYSHFTNRLAILPKACYPAALLDYTDKSLRRLYAALRTQAFDDEGIPESLPICWNHSMPDNANAWFKDGEIHLNPRTKVPLKLLLTHEMIHVKHPGKGHGKEFLWEVLRIRVKTGMEVPVPPNATSE